MSRQLQIQRQYYHRRRQATKAAKSTAKVQTCPAKDKQRVSHNVHVNYTRPRSSQLSHPFTRTPSPTLLEGRSLVETAHGVVVAVSHSLLHPWGRRRIPHVTSERLCVSPETYTEPKTGTTHSTQTWYDCLWCNTRCSAEIFLLEHIIAKHHRDQCRTPADPGCDPAPSRVSVEHQTDTATVRGGGMVSIGGPGGSREVGPLQIARCMQLLHVRRMVTNANECKSKKVKLCLTKDYTGTERIDENKYNYLPPSEQVNSILDMIHTQFLEEQLKHVLVILDYGTFSMHSIKEFSDNHVSKKVLQDFKDERFFLVNKQFNTVCTESELDMSSVHKIGNATSAYGDVDLVL